MIAKETETFINSAVATELQKACETFGACYNSSHEGWAVLKEEIDETSENLEEIQKHLEQMWDCVRVDDADGIKTESRLIGLYAIYLAQEACQVAAVAKKLRG